MEDNQVDSKKADFNILMVGGRRTGKTSVLASFLKGFQDRFAGANITLTPGNVHTNLILSDKTMELSNVFNKHGTHDKFDPDVDPAPNWERIDYTFTMKIKGRDKPRYSLRFTDIPGEWFFEPEKHGEWIEKEVQQLFKETNVMIIAIDTPHLLEGDDSQGSGYGQYHETFNSVNIFTNKIMDQFFIEAEGNASRKMVLFMPLKCEKYFWENRQSEITPAVEKGYAKLLKHLDGDQLKNNCQIAIVPVQTMGNFIFHKFGEDDEGNVIMHSVRPVPIFSLYRFPNKKAHDEGLNPKYCEQPLAYILTYILKMAQSDLLTINNNWFIKLLSFFGIIQLAKDREMQEAIAVVSGKIEKSPANGFKIVQNPLHF